MSFQHLGWKTHLIFHKLWFQKGSINARFIPNWWNVVFSDVCNAAIKWFIKRCTKMYSCGQMCNCVCENAAPEFGHFLLRNNAALAYFVQQGDRNRSVISPCRAIWLMCNLDNVFLRWNNILLVQCFFFLNFIISWRSWMKGPVWTKSRVMWLVSGNVQPIRQPIPLGNFRSTLVGLKPIVFLRRWDWYTWEDLSGLLILPWYKQNLIKWAGKKQSLMSFFSKQQCFPSRNTKADVCVHAGFKKTTTWRISQAFFAWKQPSTASLVAGDGCECFLICWLALWDF